MVSAPVSEEHTNGLRPRRVDSAMSTPLASEASTPPAVADVDPPVPSLLSARERKAIRDLIQPGEKLRFRDLGSRPGQSVFDSRATASGFTFQGFYVLFWLRTGLWMITTMVQTYLRTGFPLTTSILELLVQRLPEMFAIDLLMVSSSIVVYLLHVFMLRANVPWIPVGAAVFVVWDMCFLAGSVMLLLACDFPWVQTAYLILHTIVMLMKQHAYWTRVGYMLHYRQRYTKLDEIVRRGWPKDADLSLTEALKEIERLKGYCRGKTGALNYPDNLTLANFVDYLLCPTLVYELEFPRNARRNWYYVLEKVCGLVGVIFIMSQVVENYILPLIPPNLETMSPSDRLAILPDVFSQMIGPMTALFLLTFYLIFDLTLNAFAEITRFADRNFYNDWWNSVDWSEFSRDWNIPVHNFLLRHVYLAIRNTMGVPKLAATLITFLVSAVLHELVMYCITGKLRAYLFSMQLLQIPLVALSHVPIIRRYRLLGNIVFWFGISVGPSIIALGYIFF